MKKSGFTLVELSISVLIISCISVVLIITFRNNLNTFSFGQKRMNFNQKILLGVRRMFYDIKRINPILTRSVSAGYLLKHENIGEPKPRIVNMKKGVDQDKGKDEIEFVIDSNQDIEDIYNIKYYLNKKSELIREVRDRIGKTKVEIVLDHITAFEVNNEPTDIKQVYVSFTANDPDNGQKPEKFDFAVRLETDFVCVKME